MVRVHQGLVLRQTLFACFFKDWLENLPEQEMVTNSTRALKTHAL